MVDQSLISKSMFDSYTYRSVPPPTQDDLASRQHYALIRPQIVLGNRVDVVFEVFHERDTLPPRNTALRRKGIEPTGCEEVVVKVFAGAIEANVSIMDARGFFAVSVQGAGQ